MKSLTTLLSFFFLACAQSPSQMHISITLDPSQMNVQWVTDSPTNTSICKYGKLSGIYTFTSVGSPSTYADGGFTGTIHNALLTQLEEGTRYYYVCGDSVGGYSREFSFSVRRRAQPTLLVDVLGDMGIDWSSFTVDALTNDVASRNTELVVHYGDISYADDRGENNAYVNDEFMRNVEPIAANVPYMVCPGNHDRQFKYAAYLNRFVMPNTNSSQRYYSFDYGPVHFTSFSTEDDFSLGSVQNNWIKEDLAQADANRKSVPWIVVFGHRPLYCSSIIMRERCEKEAPLYRSYIEDLLHKYKVDIYMSGHNHNYERTYPVYKENPTDTSSSHEFKDPTAPVYAVCGSAGNVEFIDPSFTIPGPSWRAAVRPLEFGYCRMNVTRDSLRWEFVNVDFDLAHVSDHFTIHKTQ